MVHIFLTFEMLKGKNHKETLVKMRQKAHRSGLSRTKGASVAPFGRLNHRLFSLKKLILFCCFKHQTQII